MTEIVNLSISQSAASELSRQSSFGGSPGEMLIDLLENKNFSEGWMHTKLTPKHVTDPLFKELKESLYIGM